MQAPLSARSRRQRGNSFHRRADRARQCIYGGRIVRHAAGTLIRGDYDSSAPINVRDAQHVFARSSAHDEGLKAGFPGAARKWSRRKQFCTFAREQRIYGNFRSQVGKRAVRIRLRHARILLAGIAGIRPEDALCAFLDLPAVRMSLRAGARLTPASTKNQRA